MSSIVILFLALFGLKQLSLVLTFCCSGILLYIFSYYRNNGDCFNPDGLFISVWFICIGLSFLQLKYKQTDWNLTMWLVVLGSAFAFAMGSMSYELSNRNSAKSNSIINEHTNVIRRQRKNISDTRFKAILIIAYIVSITAFVIEVLAAGGIPIFSPNFGSYARFGLPYVHYLVISLGMVLVLTYVYFITMKKDFTLKFFFILGWLVLISMLNRHVILFSLIGILVAHNYYINKISIKKMGLFLVTVFVGFTVLGNLRHVSYEHLYLYAGFKEEHNLMIMWFYHYLTVGFTNLAELINYDLPISWGLHTFTPFWTLTGLKTLFPYARSPFFSGVGTFLEGYYLDFGMVGVLIMPFLLGLFSKVIYLKIRSGKVNIITLSLYCCVVNELFFLFFTDYFSYTHIPIQVVMASIIYYYVRKRNITNSVILSDNYKNN